MTDGDLEAIVARFQAQLAVARERTATALLDAWDALPSYDEGDVATLATRTETTIAAGKAAGVRLGSALTAIVLGAAAAPVALDRVRTTFDPRAPFVTVWHALAQGHPPAQAAASGRSRLVDDASDLVVRSARQAGDFAAPRHVRWRRVTDGAPCAWCSDAAKKTYRSASSADFGHGRCGCAVIPAA